MILRALPLALLLPLAPAAAQSGLLVNGGFEQLQGGQAVGWPGLGPANLSSTVVRSGQRAAAIERDQPGDGPSWQQGWLPTVAGRSYKLIGHLRCDRFEGEGWGFPDLSITHADWSTERIAPERILAACGDGQWHGFVLRFTARPGGSRVSFGVFGPKARVRLYFDDLAVIEAPAANQPPSVSATVGPLAGTAPLAVSVAAQANDPDGAVEAVFWDMGDGSLLEAAAATHVYRSRGPHRITLRAYDDDGAVAVREWTVAVEDPAAPVLSISEPAPDGETSAASVSIRGSAAPAAADPAPLVDIVWDALDLEPATAGRVSAAASFVIPAVPLKPGWNRILLTLRDAQGRVATALLRVRRTLAAPAIRELETDPRTLPRHATWRARFAVDTVARFPFLDFDPSAPPGAEGSEGVRVEARITLPDGRHLIQPAFHRAEVVERDGGLFDTGARRFELRYTPRTAGVHALRLRVRDAAGETELDLGSITVTEGSRLGFIRRATDSRYFERDSGHPYVPVGPALDPRHFDNQGALTWRRPWLGGFGAYSTNWSRWISSAERHGNEGFMAPLDHRERAPGAELSLSLFCRASCGGNEDDGDGWRLWQGFLLEPGTEPRIVAGRRYRLLLRLRIEPLLPRAAGPFGLAVKVHDWPAPGQGWRAYLENLPPSHTLLAPLAATRPWHSVLVDFVAARDADDLSLYLHNVASGRVAIDTVSLRELAADGSYASGELLRNPRADHHRYVDEKGAAAIDRLLAAAEAQGVALQLVVQDKNDWIPNRLTRHGYFARRGDGYYQGEGTRWRWLARQWWRYLAARYGASTAVFAFELNNEGSPDDPAHWRAAQDFARFFAEQAHPHLASTSFWCCWRPQFWGDHQNYPDLGYADLHEYTSDGELGSEREALESDFAALHLFRVQKVRQSPVGRPVIRAESGLEPGTPNFALLAGTPNPGFWFHELLWAQLDGSGVFDTGYWWQEHFAAIDRHYFGGDQGGRARVALAAPYAAFVASLGREGGGFVDLEPAVTGSLRVIGQRHPGRHEAHAWVQNPRSTWKRWMLEPGAVTPASGTIRIALGAPGRYRIERWDTWQGGIAAIEDRDSDPSGRVEIAVSGLLRDLALRVRRLGPAGTIFADGFESL